MGFNPTILELKAILSSDWQTRRCRFNPTILELKEALGLNVVWNAQRFNPTILELKGDDSIIFFFFQCAI